MDFQSQESTPVHPARAGRVVAGVIFALGSAALFYFGTGFAPMAVLTWLAPLPVLFMAPRVPPVAAAVMAFFGYFLGTINEWGFFTHSHDEPVSIGLTVSAGSALVFALAVLLFRGLILRGRPVLATVAGPALWAGALSLIVLYSPTGIMGTLATTQTDLPMLVQTASVTGFLGIEFLVLFVPCVLAALAAPAEVRPAARVRTLVLIAVVAGLVLGGGALRLALARPSGPAEHVALITTTNPAWAPDLATPAGSALLDGYAAKISAVPEGTQLVVLPEGSFTANGGSLSALVAKLSPIAADRDVTIVVGIMETSGEIRNNLALSILPNGSTVNYLKWHDQVATKGHQLVYPQLTGAKLGVEICADADFTNPSRGYARGGARLLAIPASDEGADALEHARTAQLRGVENGVGIAWSDRDGTMLVADGFGNVVARTDSSTAPGQFATLTAAIPPNPGTTLYTRFGDWFGWMCLGLALLGLIGSFIPARGSSGGASSAADQPRADSLVGSGT
ncbi:MAG TPA: nitrilase-related carbon-nitrogen hydrolase [Pseudonocardiaceae bacterium]|nr:nitrilase-related carbon-nitrogen hydrolase [Pseudonocardiaceae bacterium]